MTVQQSTGPILIVDDNPAIREILADALQSSGYGVVEAADGDEALDIAQISHPALILLDLNMPVVTGFAFVSSAQQRGITAPILLVTADPRASTVALDSQVVGFLTKPFDLDNVLGVIDNVMRDA